MTTTTTRQFCAGAQRDARLGTHTDLGTDTDPEPRVHRRRPFDLHWRKAPAARRRLHPQLRHVNASQKYFVFVFIIVTFISFSVSFKSVCNAFYSQTLVML